MTTPTGTATFAFNTTWTPSNALQPTQQSPINLPIFTDTLPTQVRYEQFELPVGSTFYSVTLPATWTQITQIQIQNTDMTLNNGVGVNYVLMRYPVSYPFTGGASAASASYAWTIGATPTAGQTFTLGSTIYTGVTSGALNNQFVVGGSAATAATNIATAINNANNGFNAVAVGAVVTITATVGVAGNSTVLLSNLTSSLITQQYVTNLIQPLGGYFSMSFNQTTTSTNPGVPLKAQSIQLCASDLSGNVGTVGPTSVFLSYVGF